jgi:hypothetical protein
MSLKDQFLEGTDWKTDRAGVLICPCGHRVEDDGQCPNGHESPIPI